MDGATLSLTVLLTGLVVVFLLLILLTFIIKLYSTLVYKAQHRTKKPEDEGQESPQHSRAPAVPAAVAPALPVAQEGIPGEIVAAIAAAVDAYYEGSGVVHTVKSIHRSRCYRTAWSTAGIMENTRPFS